MGAVEGVFGWLGRQGIVYVLLVAAIGASAWVWPALVQLAIGTSPLQQRAKTLDAALVQVTAKRTVLQASFARRAGDLRGASLSELDRRVGELRQERATLQAEIARAPSPLLLALKGVGAVLAIERKRLRAAWIDQELPAVEAARELVGSNEAALQALVSERAQWTAISRLSGPCASARTRVTQFEVHWFPYKWWNRAEHGALVNARNAACASYAKAYERWRGVHEGVSRTRAAVRNADEKYRAAARATDRLTHADGPLVQAASQASDEWLSSFQAKLQVWAEWFQLPTILRQAALALALIIAGPFLIRLLCFYGLAPLAMRRPAIRLRVPGGAGEAIPTAGRSTTSVAVRLDRDEELLVRQDYLQTTSHAGAKGTQWFLDWRHPITSLATGLTFLTRIRGEGETTTVSAVRDPFAEVTIVTLPEGTACVLHPRALAAVAQPIGRRLRVRTHWRLASLNAWLTLQLRYVVFHGPARLVVKGGRGVRVERAERGRVFGQDQLVGFSADLGYSVTRTETFWPYFLGREQLLKDRVEAGTGVLIVEEAPLTARGGEPRRGIEGLVDVAMKAVGL